MGSADVIYLHSGVRIRIESQRTSYGWHSRKTGKLYASIAHRYGIKVKTKIVNETKDGKFVERVVDAVRQFEANADPLVAAHETMKRNAEAIVAEVGGRLSFSGLEISIPGIKIEFVDVDTAHVVITAPPDVVLAIARAAKEILDTRELAMAGCQRYRSRKESDK